MKLKSIQEIEINKNHNMADSKLITSSRKGLLTLACVSMLLSSAVAAPIRMSPAERKKENSKDLNRGPKQQRRLKSKFFYFILLITINDVQNASSHILILTESSSL